MTRIALLWHHHQPDYRDPASGRPIMPWVRLHALRGYRDVASAVRRSGVPMTINLVPSLLDQLDWYIAGGDDPHLALTRVPAAELDPVEADRIRRDFFAGHPAMWAAHPAAERLLRRRDDGDLQGTQALLDAQVWSTLVWVGWSALDAWPELQALRDKASRFTEDDKERLLSICAQAVAEVPALHSQLAGVGEVCASAYYHPILPLLVDARHARRCLPDLPDEVRFAWPQDALGQLRAGKARVEQAVGVEVRGLWPSEGSISPEVAELAREAGFDWLVSDVGNLMLSERDPGELAAPWALGGGLRGFFRDRELSDAIGFRYATRPADEAVAELADALAQRRGLVTIALDGENPWESFPDAGRAFLLGLCRALAERRDLCATTFSQAADELPVAGRVHRLHTGSSINSDFDIWIGDSEDRAAWRLLAEAREAVAAAGDPPAALEPLYAAEGSDWFWWYGPQFHTPFAGEFDRLFRAHLRAAYLALGAPVPPALSRPLKRVDTPPQSVQEPTGEVDPSGRRDGWFDWRGAGWLDCRQPGGSMAQGARHLDGVAFGHGGGRAWLRLEHRRPQPPEPDGSEWELVLEHDGEAQLLRWSYADDGADPGPVHRLGSRTVVGVECGAPARAHLSVVRNGSILARYPGQGELDVHAPDPDWWV